MRVNWSTTCALPHESRPFGRGRSIAIAMANASLSERKSSGTGTVFLLIPIRSKVGELKEFKS